MTATAEQKIMNAVQDAAIRRLWGQIQIDFQRGQPVMIRVTETRKLYEENNSNEKTEFCR